MTTAREREHEAVIDFAAGRAHNPDNGKLFSDGMTLWSFGFHYPLAMHVDDFDLGHGFWVNTDKYELDENGATSRRTEEHKNRLTRWLKAHGYIGTAITQVIGKYRYRLWASEERVRARAERERQDRVVGHLTGDDLDDRINAGIATIREVVPGTGSILGAVWGEVSR